MLRFRRYRLFLICAILLTILLVKLSHKAQWEGTPTLNFEGIPSTWEGYRDGYKEDAKDHTEKITAPKEKPKELSKGYPKEESLKSAQSSLPTSKSIVPEVITRSKTSASSVQETVNSTPTPTSSPTLFQSSTLSQIDKAVPAVVIPDRTTEPPTEVQSKSHGAINQTVPGELKANDLILSSPTPVYWVKQPEHFPVPSESIIQLPTGKPIPIPKIQHAFTDETPMGRVKRLERLGMVKEEFKRAWKGYRSKAWMHDELSPVSGKFRDPFGGWAATLVDSLDTLWIMKLEEEFEEAVRAVAKIDFTTAVRPDIQMFETTIRYLGGLLGAFDVSGGTRRILLDKAVQLAEVLMGAFDTPNRMPELYYNWRPAFASQRHRASTRSNLAELGTLSMEFTRLAQITKESKYYDAIARITNALEEWQNRGTSLPGVFPDNVDASGCNRSAPEVDNSMPTAVELPVNSSSTGTQGYEVPMPLVAVEPKPKKGKEAKEKVFSDLEITIAEGQSGQPGSAYIQKVPTDAGKADQIPGKISRRQVSDGIVIHNSTAHTGAPLEDELKASRSSQFGRFSQLAADSDKDDWDCIPQGLTASSTRGFESFSMGSGQDSTYEYFPKQYLLLGGLEDKYREMYLKAMKAVRKTMLYRPMIPGNQDILFSGQVTTMGSPEKVRFDAEVTHLTCFVGGMFGMGAKIFGIEADVEIAKKLSDGCVWAYESMPSGLMPEAAAVLPCGSVIDCSWNQTLWEESLDPLGKDRDQRAKTYDIEKAKHDTEDEAQKIAAKAKLDIEEKESLIVPALEQLNQTLNALESIAPAADVDVDSKPPVSTRDEEDNENITATDLAVESDSRLRKRQLEAETQKTTSDALPPQNVTDLTIEQLQDKITQTKLELDAAGAGRNVKHPSIPVPQIPVPGEVAASPPRPLTHKEYIEYKIKSEGLVPGYTRIRDNRYILRPEAIESVWYMYRITGDPTWQEKGWKMFEHIINATSTPYGHSAIRGISKPSEMTQVDEMESFWLAETLKYFYLLFSTPDTISLDEWVLNTEAHPFKRPK